MPKRASAPAAVQKQAASSWRVPARAGLPLAPPLLKEMQQRVRAPLEDVRIHEDEAVSDRGAHAFTRGRHIVFGKGQFQPQTAQGRRLLAHELVHFKQQGERRVAPLHGTAEGISLHQGLEMEADRVADGLSAPKPQPRFGARAQFGRGAVVQPQLEGGTEGAVAGSGPDALLKMIAGLQAQFDKVRAAAAAQKAKAKSGNANAAAAPSDAKPVPKPSAQTPAPAGPRRKASARKAAAEARGSYAQSAMGQIVRGSLAASRGGDTRALQALARVQRTHTDEPVTRARAGAVSEGSPAARPATGINPAAAPVAGINPAGEGQPAPVKLSKFHGMQRKMAVKASHAAMRSRLKGHLADHKKFRQAKFKEHEAATQVEGSTAPTPRLRLRTRPAPSAVQAPAIRDPRGPDHDDEDDQKEGA